MRWLRAGKTVLGWHGRAAPAGDARHQRGFPFGAHCGPAQAFAIVSAPRMEWMREPRLLRTSYDTWMICALRCSHAVAGSALPQTAATSCWQFSCLSSLGLRCLCCLREAARPLESPAPRECALQLLGPTDAAATCCPDTSKRALIPRALDAEQLRQLRSASARA